MKLRNKVLLFLVPILALGLNSGTWADDLDVTIMVVGEEDTPEDAFELIVLPDVVTEAGVENSQNGLDNANAAREGGRAFGQSKAEEAKQKGQAAKENAMKAANNAANQQQESIKDRVSSKVPKAAEEHIPEDVLDRINNDHKPDLPRQLPPQAQPNRP